MKRRNDIDRIGLGLLEATRPGADEIEEIFSKAGLYESILARVKAGNVSVSENHRSRLLPNLARAAGVLAFAALTLFALSSFFSSKDSVRPRQIVVKNEIQPIKHAEPEREIVSDEIVDPKQSARFEDHAARISYRPETPARRKITRADANPKNREAVAEFYPVSYAGDPHEFARGGRVVRVELSRASLFAMGVNVPLENDAETIKTDLLIGTDGVTRAIRLVE